jgi:hypothetical protein
MCLLVPTRSRVGCAIPPCLEIVENDIDIEVLSTVEYSECSKIQEWIVTLKVQRRANRHVGTEGRWVKRWES